MISSADADSSPIVLDPEKVLSALGNRLRWQMFRLLAAGTPMHAAAVAREFDRDFDGISKHLRILRAAGLLQSRRAADRRVEQYFLPAAFRKTPGQIELGFCLLRVPEAKPETRKKPPPPPAQDGPLEDESIEDEVPVRGFGEMLAESTAIGSDRES